MIIHSVISPDDIFFNAVSAARTIKIDGGFLETEETGGEIRVRRLISTDPSMYLKKEYYPFSGYKE